MGHQIAAASMQLITVLVTFAVVLGLVALTWKAANCSEVVLKACLTNLRDVIFSIVQIAALVLLLILIGMVVAWMSGTGNGTVIIPFDNATPNDNYNGKAISDSLIVELNRIHQLHSTRLEPVGRIARPRDASELKKTPFLTSNRENVSESIANLGTIGVGEATVSIGWVLVILKRLWPIGDPGSVITGSIQRYGDTVRIVARKEHHDVRAWEITGKISSDDQIPSLVRDLAYKIAKDELKDVLCWRPRYLSKLRTKWAEINGAHATAAFSEGGFFCGHAVGLGERLEAKRKLLELQHGAGVKGAVVNKGEVLGLF